MPLDASGAINVGGTQANLTPGSTLSAGPMSFDGALTLQHDSTIKVNWFTNPVDHGSLNLDEGASILFNQLTNSSLVVKGSFTR